VRERPGVVPAARAAKLPLPLGHLAYQPRWPQRRTKPPGGVSPKATRLKPSVIALGTALPLLPSNAADVLLEHRRIAMLVKDQEADRKRRGVLPLLTHLIPHPMVVRTICRKMAAPRVVDQEAVVLTLADQEAAVPEVVPQKRVDQERAALKEAVRVPRTIEAEALKITGQKVISPQNHSVKANNNSRSL
jgi:hypothetical protein